jgi:hypothetical protein
MKRVVAAVSVPKATSSKVSGLGSRLSRRRPATGQRVSRLAAALLASVLALNWAPVAESAPAPVHAVSAGGQVAYNYEALLYQLFGPSVVMCHNLVVKIHDLPTTVHNWWVNANQFPKNEPTLDGDSAANCPSYGYTFTHFGRSTFHLEPDWFAINPSAFIFGATSGPMFINGRYVACDPAGTALLGDLSGVGATLACFGLQ